MGTLAWLREDLKAFLFREGDGLQIPSPIEGLLLPKAERVATWSTRLYAYAQLADQLPLPNQVRAVVLDGAGAVKYLQEIEAPIVICILDRSVSDETAAEIVIQLRNTRGEPLSVRDDLGWRPPTGLEVLAFSVPL